MKHERCISHLRYGRRTPLVILVPVLVTYPLRLSDRCDDSTNVEGPFSDDSNAAHSSSPDLKEANVSLSDSSSQSSSRAYRGRHKPRLESFETKQHTRDSVSFRRRSPGSIGGQIAIDIFAAYTTRSSPLRQEFAQSLLSELRGAKLIGQHSEKTNPATRSGYW
jgi:hypothetical protein